MFFFGLYYFDDHINLQNLSHPASIPVQELHQERMKSLALKNNWLGRSMT